MKDIYVKFTKKTASKDIKGESQDKGHSEWVEVSSWNHQIVQPKSATASSAGGHTSERCEHGEMVFTKDYDLASVSLWEACSAGYAYDVKIVFCRANGTDRVEYLTIDLTNAIVSRTGLTVPAEGLPVETFALKYSKVAWAHVGSKADGTKTGSTPASWNLANNTPT